MSYLVVVSTPFEFDDFNGLYRKYRARAQKPLWDRLSHKWKVGFIFQNLPDTLNFEREVSYLPGITHISRAPSEFYSFSPREPKEQDSQRQNTQRSNNSHNQGRILTH